MATDDRNGFNVVLKLIRISLLLIASITSLCTLALNKFVDVFTKIELNYSYSSLLSTSLLTSLVLLLIRDFIPSAKAVAKESINLAASLFISVYMVLGSVVDVARFSTCSYVYIPPMFIVLEYQPTMSVSTFKSLTFSIPLGIAFIVLVYSLYELIKTLIAIRIKHLGEVMDRADAQDIHSVVS